MSEVWQRLSWWDGEENYPPLGCVCKRKYPPQLTRQSHNLLPLQPGGALRYSDILTVPGPIPTPGVTNGYLARCSQACVFSDPLQG